jgi:twitching motility protein PilT
MDRLQRMAEYVRKQKGLCVILRGNDTCVLVNQRGRQPLNKLMSAEEIESLIREVLPADQAAKLDQSESWAFTHPTPEGSLEVHVARPDGRLEVTITLPGAAPGATPAGDIPPETATPSPLPDSALGLAPVAPAAPPVAVEGPAPSVLPPTAPAVFARPVVTYPADYLPGLFRAALVAPASDIYLQPGVKPWARVNGEVRPLDYGAVLTPEQLDGALFDLVPSPLRHRWLETGALTFGHTFEDRARLRCVLATDGTGTSATVRLLPLVPPTLEQLQAPGFVGDLARSPRGLVLLGGVHGSGVSSTLAGMLRIVGAERRARVVTLEAPIEFLHRAEQSLVTQIEVATQVPTFAEGIRRLSLADIDVCVVGDATDPETLLASLQLAEAGALVLAAVRLPDAPAVVERLLDTLAASGAQGPGERLLRALRGVVCQRLCRPKWAGPRLPVFELLNLGQAAATLIRQGKPRELHSTMFTSFDSILAGLVKEGKVTRDEALRQGTDLDALRKVLPVE